MEDAAAGAFLPSLSVLRDLRTLRRFASCAVTAPMVGSAAGTLLRILDARDPVIAADIAVLLIRHNTLSIRDSIYFFGYVNTYR